MTHAPSPQPSPQVSRSRLHNAFTLIEVLIVIAVIGILAAVVYTTTRSGIEYSAKSAMTSTLDAVGTQLKAAANEGKFPNVLPKTYDATKTDVVLSFGLTGTDYYCINATHKKYPGLKYYIDSSSTDPQEGDCSASRVAGPQLTCPSGGTLSGTNCVRTYSATYNSGSSGGYYCPSGGSLSGTTCTTTTTYAASYQPGSSGYYYCPSGGSLSGSTCTSTTSYGATWVSGGMDYCLPGYTYVSPGVCRSPSGGLVSSESQGYTCPSGGSLSGSTCTKTTSYTASWSSGYSGYYYCSGGGTLSGTTCTGTSTYAATYSSGTSPYYSCPSGGTLSGTTCTETYPAVVN